MLIKGHYSGFTMDQLAFALGMSKKTLYVHFPSKEALAAAIVAATGATIRRQAGEVFASPLPFPAKFEAVLLLIAEHFGVMGPDFLDDLERHAPTIRREIDRLKEHNIPIVFGRILVLGIEEGMVRADVDVVFLVEYWLQVIKGVHDPDVLVRTGLTPRAAFEKALDLFFCGLLTPAGHASSRWASGHTDGAPKAGA